jgi:hypothetical protein
VAVLPLWQEAQLVLALKPLWSTFAPAQEVVLWHFSQFTGPLWMGVVGLPTALPNVPLGAPVWQVLHWLATVKLRWKRPGFQVANPALWQASQEAAAEAVMS